jgi:hypothetical protein
MAVNRTLQSVAGAGHASYGARQMAANMQPCWRGERRAGVATLRRQLGCREDVMSKSATTCAILLMASGFVGLAWAQGKVDTASPVPPNFSFPAGAEITFQWNYTCRNSKPCAFSCGAASSVRALTLYLGTIPVGSTQKNSVIFYFYSTTTIPYNDGFRISGGPASTLVSVSKLLESSESVGIQRR